MRGEAPVLLLEQLRVDALGPVAVRVDRPVPVHRVDEEQRQHLDPLRPQPLLLVQVLADRAVDHQPLDRGRVHVAEGLARPQVVLATRCPELHVLVAGGHADLANEVVRVLRAARRLLEVVSVLDDLLDALHAVQRLHVQLHAGRDRAPRVRRPRSAARTPC